MGMFANINLNEFRGSGGGAYIEVEGQFLIRLNKVEFKTKQGGSATRYIVDFNVLESSVPDKVPVGCKRGNVIKVSDHSYPETALGNLADATRVFGVCFQRYWQQPEDSVEKYDADTYFPWQVSADQPLKNVVVKLETVLITTKGGKPFTKHHYLVPTPEEVARHRV